MTSWLVKTIILFIVLILQVLVVDLSIMFKKNALGFS